MFLCRKSYYAMKGVEGGTSESVRLRNNLSGSVSVNSGSESRSVFVVSYLFGLIWNRNLEVLKVGLLINFLLLLITLPGKRMGCQHKCCVSILVHLTSFTGGQ